MTADGRTLRRASMGVALAWLVGCSEGGGPSGPPVLQGIDIIDATGAHVMVDPAGGAVDSMPLSPRVHFVFRFDRLLDPELLEELIDGKPVGNSEVVILETEGEPDALVTYIPNGHAKHKLIFSGGPAVVVSPQPTLPSGAPVRVSLDKDLIQSRGGSAPFVAAEGISDALSFSTVPFAATIEPMEPPAEGQPLAGRAHLAVTFNNLPADNIADDITVEVFDAAGAPLPEVTGTVLADAMDPTRWLVSPAGGSWPAGARVTITIDESATDALGMRMMEMTAQSFEVVR